MPPKRACIGSVDPNAKRMRAARERETSQQREARLEAERTRMSQTRASETLEERTQRLEDQRRRTSQIRASETLEERENRLSYMRSRVHELRAGETMEQRQLQGEQDRVRIAERHTLETQEQYRERLEAHETLAAEYRILENSAQSQASREVHRLNVAQLRAAETPDQRESRLESDRRRHAQTRQADRWANLRLAALNYTPSYDFSAHPKVVIGKMDVVCAHCQARKFATEAPGMCCSNGKVRLPYIESPPEPLLSYMAGTTPESKHFLQNIRKYNACFQMTSFGTTVAVDENGFMPTFKVQGQIYHRIGSLLPVPNDVPKFLQLYFVSDEQLQSRYRRENIPGVREDIVLSLQRMLHRCNNLVKLFKTALDRMPMDDYKVVIHADRRPRNEHERRFNSPSVNEVAIVMVGNECDRRDIIIQKRSDELQRIAETHRSYDSLQYPLILWEGQDGYHFNLMQTDPNNGRTTNKKISAMDFYAYHLMTRSASSNHILKCRQLFHQYIVDMYAKIEAERLLYIRLNQRKLRVEDYIHLRDAVTNDGNVADLGQQVILPATFTGSPRHMHEYAQDAMSYVRIYGRPDLFITFTCNPAWKEVSEELFVGQTPADRHDLTARIFKQKLTKLMDVITKSHVYGETRCWMYSIEWQKRGLPHSHILLWLKDKIRPNQVDDIISAELPNPHEDPTLFEIITKNMIHGPCGPINPSSPCMRDGKCTKKYPRQMIRETQTGNDGYPLYRRRSPQDGGFTTKLRLRIDDQLTEIDLDNRWIVPYTPLLSKMFQAHINVEYCSSVKSIKYICKYINKGGDMAVFRLEQGSTSNDEVTQYQTGRYISSNEAVWRILNFKIHDRYPPVVHLSVHLENGQRVYFTTENARERAAHPPNTTLTAFFLLCQEDAFARTLLYPEVPKYYTWNKTTKKFCRRKQGGLVPGHDIRAADVIGRVYTVHPRYAECFYLRLLLHTVRGPTSFAALKTIEGEQCETYREACQKLGLLESDEHWDATMSEASLRCFAAQLRGLFAVILTTCSPSNPRSLWEKYKEALSEDILRETRRQTSLELEFSPEIFNQALILIEDNCISITGQTLSQLGLNTPNRENNHALEDDVLRERSYDRNELESYVENNIHLLTEDQRAAYTAIMSAVTEETGGLFFLNAPGGTGKTFLINLLLAEIRRGGAIAVAVASSGIASTLLQGGRTAHSALKLPLDFTLSDNPMCSISKGSSKAQMLRSCKLIVWDECTMAHRKALEALNRTLQDLRESNELMGGLTVLLAGDFRQTLPVIPRATPADELSACLKSSVLWRHVQILTLRTNMRVHLLRDVTAGNFAQQLLSLGDGRLPSDPQTDLIDFPAGFCNLVQSIDELIEKVFPDIGANYTDLTWLCERAILAPRNDCVNSVNLRIQSSLPGSAFIYKSIDAMVDEDQTVNYPVEFLNSLEPPGFPTHELQLKCGSPIILMRNINPPKLCNGTRLCIENLMPHVIEARILTGTFTGEVVFIPRIPLISTNLPFIFKRLQFPVRLAFAMSINKAQGQSLRVAGVNLEYPCFSHGQLYVACSRVGTPKNLYIYAPDGKTKNIVYNSALC